MYQQTFLKALEVLGQIDIEQNPKSFLISIAISIWKNTKRKSAHCHRIAPTTNMEDLQYEEVACSLNIEASGKFNQDLKRTLRIQQAKPSTFSLW